MIIIDRETHPRPRFIRERWTDLTGPWRFAYDDGGVGLAERWYAGGPDRFNREIVVPYPPESELSGIGDTSFHPVLWYQRDVEVPEVSAGERVLLHLGAVDYRASVWLNGQHLVDHEGGHMPCGPS